MLGCNAEHAYYRYRVMFIEHQSMFKAAATAEKSVLLVKMLKENQQISAEEKTLHKGDLLFHQSCKTVKIKLLICPK